MAMGTAGAGGTANDAGHDHAAAAQMMGINGRAFDMHRVDVTTRRGTSEIWEIQSATMAHPFHIHGASFRILSKNGRTPAARMSSAMAFANAPTWRSERPEQMTK